MFGTFQQSSLRIEIDATADRLQACLTQPAELRQWLKFQRFPSGLPDTLTPGTHFTSHGGWVIPIQQTVTLVEPNRIRFVLAQGIDGFHEWAWGDGWIQSQIEGISALPIGLAQTSSLMLLKQYV
jgi:uncharacterized protein YndB with AHSA1/START domain